MPRVTFIGGFKDGEVSNMPSLEARVEFKEIIRPNIAIPRPEDANKPVEIFAEYKYDYYVLQHLVSHEEKFWFYVEESIGPKGWVYKLVDGYHPIREEEN